MDNRALTQWEWQRRDEALRRTHPVVHWLAHYMPDVLLILAIVGVVLVYVAGAGQ